MALTELGLNSATRRTALERPNRIVCVSADAADWLARIGAWDQVVGVTAFFQLPEELPPKPRVSGFSTGNLGEIIELRPDLVIGFSDVQADLAAELIRVGIPVFVTNQRSLDETHRTLASLARFVGQEAAAVPLLAEFQRRLEPVKRQGRPPRVYFEEWYDPPVTGIGWVSELIERAGGDDIFAAYRDRRAARDRQVGSEDILAADPEIVIASWCGKPVHWELVHSRPGWNNMAAVRTSRLYEIPSDDLLQPGWRVVLGYERLKQIIADWSAA